MPAIVEFPQVVRDALDQFGDLFACEPQHWRLAEYLTGLMVAANKTVTGINGEFANTTDPYCLNRFLTEVEWDQNALNERRLELLQHDPHTRYSAQGVIAIDDTLIDHHGKFIKDVGWFWDHAKERNKIAHDYLFVNYVCTSGKPQLGTGDCQLRDGQGQTRHMYVVMLAYSLLMRQPRQDRARDWACCRLKTIGEACRAMLDETLRATRTWVVQQIQDYKKDRNDVFAKLRLT